jgi:hypothetical protein
MKENEPDSGFRLILCVGYVKGQSTVNIPIIAGSEH